MMWLAWNWAIQYNHIHKCTFGCSIQLPALYYVIEPEFGINYLQDNFKIPSWLRYVHLISRSLRPCDFTHTIKWKQCGPIRTCFPLRNTQIHQYQNLYTNTQTLKPHTLYFQNNQMLENCFVESIWFGFWFQF